MQAAANNRSLQVDEITPEFGQASEMSLAAASSSCNGEPDAKKFRYSMPNQVAKHPLYDMNQNQGANRPSNQDEKPQLNGSALSSIFDSAEALSGRISPQNRTSSSEEQLTVKEEHPAESEGSVPESPANLENRDSNESPVHDPISAFLEQAANIFSANFKNLNKEESIPPQDSMPKLTPPPSQSHQSMHATIPGALAVAASPAAQLFDAQDWSWHRNPAASIRSGGTNKQTPVWKYFVYNKTENLSRCIIGDCTYVLKGPHTSTLACHLKKHSAEYAEFQRLKMEYTRDRTTGTISSNGSISGGQRNGRASSAASNGSTSSGHGTPFGCNNKQGSSVGALQNSVSPPTNNAPTMVHRTPSVQPKSQNKKPQEQMNPLNSIFGNPLLNNMAPNMNRQSLPAGIKNPSSMNDLLNSLSARAAASLVSQQNLASCSSSVPSRNSPISTPALTPTSDQQIMPMQFMNFLKQNNNGIFGPANAPNFDQKALLQQHQSKKWPRHERKQRELETKLALALCSLQVPLHKLNDPFLRDFIESVQPKFQLIASGEPLEQILTQIHTRALANMKASLAAVSKLTLMVNAVPTEDLSQETNQYQGQLCLCISVAYYSQPQQQVETILLGVRKTSASELTKNIRQIVSKVFSSFDLNFDQVSHTILDGFEQLGIRNEQLDLPNQLRSYRRYLLQALHEIVDASELYAEIYKAVKRMIQSFCAYPDALMRLSRLCGPTLVTGLQQMPFEKLAQTLLEIRDSFIAVCCQQPMDQMINMISDSQWAILDNILRLKRTFNAHMEIVQENAYATIDRVVPSIMQLLMTLEKDFPLLEPLPEQLTASIHQKLAFILDPQAKDFDSSFIQATALNPHLVVLLDEQQLCSAKTQIEKTLTDRTRVNGEEPANKRSGLKVSGGLDALLAAVVERKSNAMALNGLPIVPKTEEDQNESVSNSTSTLYPDLVQAANQRRKQNKERTQNGKNHYIEAMIQAYFDDALNNSSCPSLFGNNTNGTCPPLQSWQMNATKCLQLSELAVELLSTPSSAIPPEFILNPSMEGGSTLMLDDYFTKHPFDFVRSDQSSLERDMQIRFNRCFWQKAQFP